MQGDAGPATEGLLARLNQLDPRLADIARSNVFGDNLPGVDDIPF